MGDDPARPSLDRRLAARLRALRVERGWSLDALAARSEVSRATLSRLENGEVSPTAAVLGRLCAAYGLTMSRLLASVEEDFAALVRQGEQPVWHDPETGFSRRQVSPPARSLTAELIRAELPAGCKIAYEVPPRPGLEHHLYVLEGALRLSLDGRAHDLAAGDCLRYHLDGPSLFETGPDSGVSYLLAML